ncbi:vomeronasal type-1 receptor 4-like [Phascolarctos cinereus]|uniref:Vomeronasal type-1 receptor n=1 Tax=Phascolarctos cinereus TaxID=38626 RepID=A0A6P5JFP1_PHACI|nr:vomeronasal type-1 receptor 4-like [Phascolarctos cinereus]
MIPHDVILGTLYLSQTGLGVLGNSILLCFFIFTSRKLRPTDQIMSQLTLANFIFLLSTGIPMKIAVFGVKDFLDDTWCKIDFYLQRVSRCLSLCSTCLLSGFQAIVISPVSSPWEGVKARAPKYIISSCIFCWLFSLLIEVGIAIGITGPQRHNTNFTVTVDLIFCTWKEPSSNFVWLTTFRDVFCVALMICTSGYKVILLRKHHQQVQHLHRTSCCPRASPEIRVTGSILLLLSTFVSFYLVNGIFAFCYTYFLHSRSSLINVSTFLVLCFPTISPFLLISRDSQVARACCVPRGRHKPWPPA